MMSFEVAYILELCFLPEGHITRKVTSLHREKKLFQKWCVFCLRKNVRALKCHPTRESCVSPIEMPMYVHFDFQVCSKGVSHK